MTETEELEIRKGALENALNEAREKLAAREARRATELAPLQAALEKLTTEVKRLEEALAELEGRSTLVTEAWRTATRDAAGAKDYLRELRREGRRG
jgi:hypothetical protein